MSVFRTKSIEQSLKDSEDPEFQLKRSLTAIDLTVFGIGVIIGAGIFTLTGQVAAETAGPAVSIAFVISAVCCAFAALCYAEFASAVPVSGSAYTFSYATVGELVAWIIGWDLLLELMLGASVVAQGWSQYAEQLLDEIGLGWPDSVGPGSHFNLLAFLLVAVLCVLVTIGIKESMRVNMVLVTIKVFIVLFVIVMGISLINTSNYTPFVPDKIPATDNSVDLTTTVWQALTGAPGQYGWTGVFAAASIVFFAFIGFDVVATTAEEAENPQRDLPIGIIASLAICTVLYVAVALVITGMVDYPNIDPEAALASAFSDRGHGTVATIVSAGAVAGLTTVVMTLLIGATRVTFAMSRDHLLPREFGHVNRTTRTPMIITIGIGVIVAATASLTPIDKLEEMVNIGTLAAFTLVSIAVVILRRTRPDLDRPFKVPGAPFTPILSAVICVYMMLNLTIETWLRFAIWMLIGFVIYFGYGIRKSRVGEAERAKSARRQPA
ncbi:MAG TPA: amino acid permease [Nocardioidaceae bacterium]